MSLHSIFFCVLVPTPQIIILNDCTPQILIVILPTLYISQTITQTLCYISCNTKPRLLFVSSFSPSPQILVPCNFFFFISLEKYKTQKIASSSRNTFYETMNEKFDQFFDETMDEKFDLVLDQAFENHFVDYGDRQEATKSKKKRAHT